MKPDTLNERNAEFDQALLQSPVFLNSVPKCGTHLLRNIMRMFVPVEQQYHDTFIQIPMLRNHLRPFSQQAPMLSWGHLLFSDDSAIALRDVRQVLLVRDPYDWVLARARFFLSDNFDGATQHLRDGRADMLDILNMMIFGIHQKVPTLEEIYRFNAVSWLGTSVKLLRYEELVAQVKDIHSRRAESYFADLFDHCGMTLPDDWRKRVEIGSDRAQSGTARENLGVEQDLVPDSLPEQQKRLVDYAAPGLRQVLGYT